MEKELKKSTVVIALVLIIAIQVIARVYVGFQKEYMHMDEAYSYALMHYDKIGITDNEDFYENWHTKDYYIDYLAINEEEMGNWTPVYENQKNDVHPPLYYALLRIAASFTVNEFTKWTGIILNMAIWVGSSILVYFIASRLFKNKKMGLLTCLLTGLTLGALDTTAYIRMYELANFFVLLITYLHMRIYDKAELKIKDLVAIGISILLGSLTHYYVIIYTAFLFILFVTKYIKKKEYKTLIQYIACFAIAAGISLAIFPHSLHHMFGGYRGEESKGRLLNLESLFSNLGLYTYIITKNLFGQLAVLMIILYLVLYFKKRKETVEKSQIHLILIPTILYFILVAQISAYKELRYIMPILSTAMISAIYVFYCLWTKYVSNKKAGILTAIIFAIILVSPVFTNTHLDFTYKWQNHLAERMEEKAEVPALYVFNENNNRFLDDITIFTKLNESYVMKYSQTSMEHIEDVLKEKDTSKGLILVYNEGVKEIENIIKQIREKYHYETEEEVQRLNAATVKYLY